MRHQSSRRARAASHQRYRHRGRFIARTTGSVTALFTSGACVHLLTLLVFAAKATRSRATVEADDVSFVVLIPAHNEADGLGGTLASLQRSEYPPERREIVVIADNCTDSTASIAAAAGVRVLERHDPDSVGKGFALAWGIEQVLATREIDAVCVIDADCEVSANFFCVLAGHLRGGARVVQGHYRVANPHESTASALRYGALELFAGVRSLGRSQLGLSAGLHGTGMAFTGELLRRRPWQAFSFAEDREQHMMLVAGGERVVFAPEAIVLTPMPTSFSKARRQQMRWESGRLKLLRTITPALLRRGVRDRDLAAVDAALEPLWPPQALLAIMTAGSMALGVLARSRRLVLWSAMNMGAQSAYVLVGLRVVEAPAVVWRALASAPAFVFKRGMLFAGLALGRGPREWESRTSWERGDA